MKKRSKPIVVAAVWSTVIISMCTFFPVSADEITGDHNIAVSAINELDTNVEIVPDENSQEQGLTNIDSDQLLIADTQEMSENWEDVVEEQVVEEVYPDSVDEGQTIPELESDSITGEIQEVLDNESEISLDESEVLYDETSGMGILEKGIEDTTVDTVQSIYASPASDRMIYLEWSYTPPEGYDVNDYVYLIYRSDSENGEFTKIAYTQMNVMSYVDAGGNMYSEGAGELYSDVTYYYRVQAYNPSENISSNLYYAAIASSVAGELTEYENTFILEDERDQVAEYLKQQISYKYEMFSIDIWAPSNLILECPIDLINTAFSDRVNTPLSCNEYTYTITDHRMVRNGNNKYTITYTFNYDTVFDLMATPYGNQMIRLEWDYIPPEGCDISDYRYLIYRSVTENGEYSKIAYTLPNTMVYVDAGGRMYGNDGLDTELVEGVTYYYKVQAYNENTGHSTNLSYAAIIASTPGIEDRAENEFILESEKEQAVSYLRESMVQRKNTVAIDIWISSKLISGYSDVLFKDAITETEEISKNNEGDYLWYHLAGNGYTCSLQDWRVKRNDLNKYTLTYTFSYYTSAEQEEDLNSLVDDIIAGFGFTGSTTKAEKVKTVYEWLVRGSSYDLSLNNGNPRCSAYDAIVNKRAVCQGYSNAMYLFMRKLGIMCRIIDGSVTYDGASRAHAWNLIEIDGQWYNVCVTTEVHMMEAYGSISYRYLLKGDDGYFSIFDRGSVPARNIDYRSSSFYISHPVNGSYDFGDLIPTLPEGVTAVTDLSAVLKNSTTVYLNWTYSPPAGDTLDQYQYLIYRSSSENGPFEKIGYTKLHTFNYSDSNNLELGKTYYYKVQAYCSNPEKSSNLYYANTSSVTIINMLNSLEVTPKSGVTMTLNWTGYSNAYSYEVWHRADGASDYELVKTTGSSQTGASHTGLTAGTRHYYQIRAKDRAGDLLAVSEEKAAVALATPVLDPVIAYQDGMHLTWSRASGADRYNIYRSTSKNGEYKYIQSVQKVENYTDTTAEAGKTYYYKVRAYKKLDDIVYYGGYSNAEVSIGQTLQGLTVVPKSGVTMTLNWTGYSNAYSYEVWHRADGASDYELVKTTGSSQTGTSHTGLTAGTRHYYQIRAKDRAGNLLAVSEEKAAVALATPVMESAEAGPEGVSLTWSKASGADRYNIYRSTSKNGDYKYIQSVQKVETYTDTTAEAGKTYYYKVRAYKKLGELLYFGGYSNCSVVTY